MPQAPLVVAPTMFFVGGITKSYAHEPLRNTRRGGAANHGARRPNIPSATAAEPRSLCGDAWPHSVAPRFPSLLSSRLLPRTSASKRSFAPHANEPHFASLHAARSGGAASTAFGGGRKRAGANGAEHWTVGATRSKLQSLLTATRSRRVASPTRCAALLLRAAALFASA